MSEHHLDPSELRQLNLEPELLLTHQAKIRGQLRAGTGVTFPILDSGTLQNRFVLRVPESPAWALEARAGIERGELCTFVPAAGAASRYLKVFDTLDSAQTSGSRAKLESGLRELRELGNLSDLSLSVPLPATDAEADLLAYAAEVWSQYGQMPKGLMPATVEGHCFLDLKLLEQQALNPGGSLVLVVSEGKVEAFAERLERSSFPQELKDRIVFLVQGRALSTLRFDGQGNAVRQKDGGLSLVVGGHGELVRLFPQVARLGSARSVFVINVDNVIGTRPETREAFARFYGFHQRLLHLLDEVREACRIRRIRPELERHLLEFLDAIDLAPERQLGGLELLEWIQRNLFHSDAGSDAWSWPELERLYGRPLTVQGMVPNTGLDVGGIPALIELDGKKVKISLEQPHATAEDQAIFFKDPKKATHFNPGFVFHEIQEDLPPERRTDPRFWMLTKKPFGGEEVYYHETVLYEAVGNSVSNNLVFVEIPRFLFRPHKVFTDCRGRKLDSYGF